jgi:hypothetical protein
VKRRFSPYTKREGRRTKSRSNSPIRRNSRTISRSVSKTRSRSSSRSRSRKNESDSSSSEPSPIREFGNEISTPKSHESDEESAYEEEEDEEDLLDDPELVAFVKRFNKQA